MYTHITHSYSYIQYNINKTQHNKDVLKVKALDSRVRDLCISITNISVMFDILIEVFLTAKCFLLHLERFSSGLSFEVFSRDTRPAVPWGVESSSCVSVAVGIIPAVSGPTLVLFWTGSVDSAGFHHSLTFPENSACLALNFRYWLAVRFDLFVISPEQWRLMFTTGIEMEGTLFFIPCLPLVGNKYCLWMHKLRLITRITQGKFTLFR